MLTVENIRTLMAADEGSQRKKDAMTGWQYYEGHHDIEKRKIYYLDENDEWQEDVLKSNIRISHPFHKELTDQVVQFLLSGDKGYMRSKMPELQKELDRRFNENENFTAEFYKTLTGVVAKGWDYMHAHKTKVGNDDVTVFVHADSLNVVEVRAKDTQANVDCVIYSYTETVMDKVIRRIQVWDAKEITYYCQVDDGEIVLDESVETNPRPHTLYTKKDGKIYQNPKNDYGQIPFFRMDNFPLNRSDLFYYKDAIDDYDLMNCDLSNNLQDTNEASYILTGFDGDNLDQLMRNFRAKKQMGVPEGGDLKAETIQVPFEARKAKMEIDKANIYHFGQGLNMEALKDSSATTNLGIQSAYSQLASRAVKLRIAAKQFLRKLLQIVLPEINRKYESDYTMDDVYIKFETELPTSALENADIELKKVQKQREKINTVLDTATRIGDEQVLKSICEELEIDYEKIKNKAPKVEEEILASEASNNLKGIIPEDSQGIEG